MDGFEKLKELAAIIPNGAALSMLDNFLARVKCAGDDESRRHEMDVLKLACTIISLKDFDEDPADDGEWKKKLREIFEEVREENKKMKMEYEGHTHSDEKGWSQSSTVIVDLKKEMAVETICPYCYAKFRVPSGIPEKAMPRVGDGNLCSVCFEPSLFYIGDEGKMHLRKPLTAEEDKEMQEMAPEFVKAREKLKALHDEGVDRMDGIEPEMMHILFRLKKNGGFNR